MIWFSSRPVTTSITQSPQHLALAPFYPIRMFDLKGPHWRMDASAMESTCTEIFFFFFCSREAYKDVCLALLLKPNEDKTLCS